MKDGIFERRQRRLGRIWLAESDYARTMIFFRRLNLCRLLAVGISGEIVCNSLKNLELWGQCGARYCP